MKKDRGHGTRSDDTASATSAATHVTRIRSRQLVAAAVRVGDVATRSRTRAASVFRRVARTVQPPGWLVLLTGTFGLLIGVACGWIEWMLAGVVALVLLVLSIPFLLDLRNYDVAVTLGRGRLTAGEPLHGAVHVRNLGSRLTLPGRIDLPVDNGAVEFAVPLLRPDHEAIHPLDLPARRRGVLVIGPATTVRSDPLGLFRRERPLDIEHVVHVHPRTVDLPSTSVGLIRDLDGNTTHRLVDADISFHAIREYVPGDAQRQIHWKSTAKTGALMVRQYEESRRSRMVVMLGVAVAEFTTEDEFELAVSCAASISLRAMRDARDLDVIVGTRIPRMVRGRLRAVVHVPTSSLRTILDAFTEVEAREETMPLDDIARVSAEENERLSLAVIVAGSRAGLDRVRRAALAFPSDTEVVCVVCDERAHPRTRRLGRVTVHTVGVLEDLSGLLLRGATG